MKDSSFERLDPKIQDPSSIYITAQQFCKSDMIKMIPHIAGNNQPPGKRTLQHPLSSPMVPKKSLRNVKTKQNKHPKFHH